MKLLTLGLIGLLASCGPLYKTTITQKISTQSPIGYDSEHLDAQNRCTPIYGTIYILEPSWRQALRNPTTNKSIFFGGLAVGGAGLGVDAVLASFGSSFALPTVGAVVSVAISAESIEWAKWNDYREIPKEEYDSIMAHGKDFGPFWASPAKAY